MIGLHCLHWLHSYFIHFDEELNRALDEYILRQMCFKSEIVDEIARLHEDSAYAILGVSSSATDAEIKKVTWIMLISNRIN